MEETCRLLRTDLARQKALVEQLTEEKQALMSQLSSGSGGSEMIDRNEEQSHQTFLFVEHNISNRQPFFLFCLRFTITINRNKEKIWTIKWNCYTFRWSTSCCSSQARWFHFQNHRIERRNYEVTKKNRTSRKLYFRNHCWIKNVNAYIFCIIIVI